MISIRAGWTGGDGDDATEDEPGGHAEAVKLVFDPGRVSYRDVLLLLLRIHRPDLGEDVPGSLHRSEMFYTTDGQRRAARDTIAEVEASGFWPKVATRGTEAGRFLDADLEGQDHFQRYPESSVFRRLAVAGPASTA